MSDVKKCPYCREEIQIDASKCWHCLEFLTTKDQDTAPDTSADRLKAWLEFAGKFVIPVFVVAALLFFRPTIESLVRTTESAEFLGVSIAFSKTGGFTGDLTPLGLYYLIGSADGGGVRYEGKSVTPINEIRDKGLVSVKIEQVATGSPEMQGTWAVMTPTKAGVEFLESMGVTVSNKP